jgi:hypothetical protein
MWHYFEHEYYPHETLQHLHSITSSQARLIIEVPNYQSYSRIKYGQFWQGWHSPRHTFAFTSKSISGILTKNNWKVEKIYPYGGLDNFTMNWLSRMEQKKIDWTQSFEGKFLFYTLGLILFLPLRLIYLNRSMGVMTIVASKA